MQTNDLSEFVLRELTGGGACHLHTHETTLDEHRHNDQLQSNETIVNTSINYTATYKDDIIVGDTTAGSVQITLPLSMGKKHFIVVKKVAANNLTIVFTGGELYLGLATITLTALGAVQRLKGITAGYIPI